MYSPGIDRVCRFCGQSLNIPISDTPAGKRVNVCSACKTPHHLECWQINKGCTTLECSNNPSSISRTGANLPETVIITLPPQVTPQTAQNHNPDLRNGGRLTLIMLIGLPLGLLLFNILGTGIIFGSSDNQLPNADIITTKAAAAIVTANLRFFATSILSTQALSTPANSIPAPLTVISTPRIDQPISTRKIRTPKTTPTKSPCPAAPEQHVQIGRRAYVCTQIDRLIVRSGPGQNYSEITRIVPGTYFRITDGPKCANDWSWWKIKTDDGIMGWVAEGGDNADPYFICPQSLNK